MNQRSSAITARRKTRFVVKRGRIGVRGVVVDAGCDEVIAESVEGREREKTIGLGAKME